TCSPPPPASGSTPDSLARPRRRRRAGRHQCRPALVRPDPCVRTAPHTRVQPSPRPPGDLMAQSLQITAAAPAPALLDLPWDVPLQVGPVGRPAALPRGTARHVVRFVKLSGRVIASKEIGETVAYREYELLRALTRLDVPSVEPVGVITGRRAPDGG